MNPSTIQTWFTVCAALFQILAIFCGLGAYHYSQKVIDIKSKKEKSQHAKVEAISEENLQKTKELLAQVQKIATSRHDELIKKYPFGYAIFVADEKDIKIPNDQNFEQEFEVRWGNAKVYGLTKDEIHINLPDMLYKPLHSSFSNIG